MLEASDQRLVLFPFRVLPACFSAHHAHFQSFAGFNESNELLVVFPKCASGVLLVSSAITVASWVVCARTRLDAVGLWGQLV